MLLKNNFQLIFYTIHSKCYFNTQQLSYSLHKSNLSISYLINVFYKLNQIPTTIIFSIFYPFIFIISIHIIILINPNPLFQTFIKQTPYFYQFFFTKITQLFTSIACIIPVYTFLQLGRHEQILKRYRCLWNMKLEFYINKNMEIKLRQQKVKTIIKNIDKSNDNKRKIQTDTNDKKIIQQKKNHIKQANKKAINRLIKRNSNSFSSDLSKSLSFQKEKKQNNKYKEKKNTVKDFDKHHSLTKLKTRPQKPISIQGFDQYFLFQNKIIPIINSDQKRVVNNFIFTPNSTGDKWKHYDSATQTYFPKKIETSDCEIMTEIVNLKQEGFQINTQLKSQSTITDIIPIKHEQLKFDQFLMKLQFLYLPQTKIFQQLNQFQKEHYKELFQTIIQKLQKKQNKFISSQSKQQTMQQCNQMMQQFQLSQKIAYIIQQRIGQQMNCIQVQIQKGIPTNLLSILSYLSNLFCFIQVQYKELLLKGLNTPYGTTISHRLSQLSQVNKYRPESNILPDQIYYQFQKQFFNDGEDQIVMQAVHIHNKVLFDCLNQELNVFRPYYGCNGEPYPWYTPGKITFYSIGQDDVELVFEKSKVKILEKASLLCGIMWKNQKNVETDIIIRSGVLKDIRDERERKLVNMQINEIDQSSKIEDERSLLLLQLCELLFEKIINEQSKQLLLLKKCKNNNNNNKIY